ncbi:MAG: GumC family protein [Devosia sp.]
MSVESLPAEDLRMDVGALFGALWARALRIVIVTILLLVAAFVILMFVPKLYESKSTILVEDRTSIFTQSTGVQAPSGTSITIDALMSSQIELIKSRDTLLAVIDSEKLRSVPEFNGAGANPLTMLLTLVGRKTVPGDETVLQNLNDRLSVVRERDSATINILVQSADPKLAASIANAIAAEHLKRRAGQSLADTAEASVWLEQQIEQLRTKVQQADSAVADYRTKNGIYAGTNGTTLPDQQMSDISRQIIDAQGRRNTAEQRSNSIRALLKSNKPVEGIDDVRTSPVMQSLMQTRATLQSTLAEKLATLLPAHPTIKALNAQIAQINVQIGAEARRIADGLAAQVGIEDGTIGALNDDLERAKLTASTQTKDSVALDSLTREAKAQRDLLDSYLLKYRDAAGRTESGSALPDVRIVTKAAPSVVPASPKTALILGAVAFVALALQIGTVLFSELMSGRAVYDRNTLRQIVDRGEIEPTLDEAEDAEEVEPVAVDATAEPAPSDEEADLADMPEPEFVAAAPMVAPVAPVSHPAPVATTVHRPPGFANLAADMALGRARIILLAGVSEARDSAIAADTLVGEALRRGLSICRIDAGSARPSTAPGLTDLCAEQASFGDVVHKVREGFAEVPWGQLQAIDRRSMRPLTLVEALADIYEIVVISTGRVGINTSLPVFAGLHGRLVMVRQAGTPDALVEAVSADAATLGFDTVEAVLLPEPQSAVA